MGRDIRPYHPCLAFFSTRPTPYRPFEELVLVTLREKTGCQQTIVGSHNRRTYEKDEEVKTLKDNETFFNRYQNTILHSIQSWSKKQVYNTSTVYRGYYMNGWARMRISFSSEIQHQHEKTKFVYPSCHVMLSLLYRYR